MTVFRSNASDLVTLTASATITQDEHDNRTMLMGAAGAALTFTLPPATGSGASFMFKVSVVNTSNYVIQVANASDTIDGCLIGCADGGNTVNGWETASTSDTITLNGTTTGGVTIGDWVELQDIATNQYVVRGQITQSGTEATPFSAAVS